jgi:hypothetical protein
MAVASIYPECLCRSWIKDTMSITEITVFKAIIDTAIDTTTSSHQGNYRNPSHQGYHGRHRSWTYCAEERKSASFFLLQRKLRSSKAQLRSLRFKILGVTFYRNFYD